VSSYSKNTWDFKDWLLGEHSQLKNVGEEYYDQLRTEEYVTLAKEITTPQRETPLRIPQYLIRSLREIIRERSIVYGWHKNLVASLGARRGPTKAKDKTRQHENFIKALVEVLGELEAYVAAHGHVPNPAANPFTPSSAHQPSTDIYGLPLGAEDDE
jgi:hypothetical protein